MATETGERQQWERKAQEAMQSEETISLVERRLKEANKRGRWSATDRRTLACLILYDLTVPHIRLVTEETRREDEE